MSWVLPFANAGTKTVPPSSVTLIISSMNLLVSSNKFG